MAKTPKKKRDVTKKKIFDKWLVELKKHKKDHGHLHVSQETYPSLYNWTLRMRLEMKIHFNNKKRPAYSTANITKTQANQLKRIGLPAVGMYKKTEGEKLTSKELR